MFDNLPKDFHMLQVISVLSWPQHDKGRCAIWEKEKFES